MAFESALAISNALALQMERRERREGIDHRRAPLFCQQNLAAKLSSELLILRRGQLGARPSFLARARKSSPAAARCGPTEPLSRRPSERAGT